jgi:hypothetical protein
MLGRFPFSRRQRFVPGGQSGEIVRGVNKVTAGAGGNSVDTR